MAKNSFPEWSALPGLRLDLSGRGVRIAHPNLPAYAEVARGLAAALEALTDTRPLVAVETEPSALAGDGPLVVLGNLMESTTVRRLYYESYDFTDLAFPGPGGFALRTIRDPLGTGAHVLLLGGSDAQGVGDAAARLVDLVRKDGVGLGYVNEVKLGRGTTAEDMDMARYLVDTDAVWSRLGQSGSWEFMEQIAACGLGYLRTGDERYLNLFRRELMYFKSHDVDAPNPEAPQQIHGRIYGLLQIWDLVRDHPRFTPDDRREFDRMFLKLARSSEGVAQIRETSKTMAVRFNHDTRAALDAFFLGRYFDRRHQLPEAREWLEVAEKLFASQLASAKPAEDSWGHQWAASMHNTLCYAMATGRGEYFTSPAFRQAADRALLAHGTDGPRVYLANCAVVTGDSSYLSLECDGDGFVRDAARMRLSKPHGSPLPASFEEVLRSFATTATIVRRESLLGLSVAPLDSLWYRTIETAAYNPGGILKITIGVDEGFDKLALREGWAAQDFYLQLDGISGGLHSFQDANCLVWLREGGVEWFRTVASYERAQGVRAQNGVNVVLNGRGTGFLHRYARLGYQDHQGDFSAMGTVLDGIGETIWERHILRRRGAWTLVLDRVVARAAGELLVERCWYPQGAHELRAAGFASRQEGDGGEVVLTIASTVAADERSRVTNGFLERVRTGIEPNGGVMLAGLLETHSGTEALKLRVEHGEIRIEDRDGFVTRVNLQHDDGEGCGLAVSGAGVEVILGRKAVMLVEMKAHELPLMPPPAALNYPFREMTLTGERITAVATRTEEMVVGTADGVVRYGDAAWRERWSARVTGPVIALEISTEGVVVGEESGALSLFDFTGQKLWTVEIPWQTLPWAYWSEGRSRVREIACADINADGREEILISNADRRVYAFDYAGRELWKRPIEWGVFTAMWPGLWEGEFALLGGTSRPSIHGYVIGLNGDGSLRGRLQREDLVCWGLPANVRDLQQADIDDDGSLETVAAVDTNCRQLIAYAEDGAVKWDCDVGACAAALAFDPRLRLVVVASEAGYVAVMEGATGARTWIAWIGEIAELVWVLPDSRIIVASRRGVVWMIDTAGKIEGRRDLGEPITAIPRAGNHRGPGRRLIFGTASGRVFVQAIELTLISDAR